MKSKLAIIAAVLVGTIALTACNQTDSTVQSEQRASQAVQGQLLQSQPIPQFKWSQLRETLIAVETAQVDSTQTTTFFFNLGVIDPISSCPSIGFPLASTTELTNPEQIVPDPNSTGGSVTIAQADPNGVYTGNSSGTYVLCVAPDGSNYVEYWEGDVQTVSGPAVWDEATHSLSLTGPSTVKVKTSR